jgi:hypothetical protein
MMFPGASGVSLKDGSFGRRGFKEILLDALSRDNLGVLIMDGLINLANIFVARGSVGMCVYLSVYG